MDYISTYTNTIYTNTEIQAADMHIHVIHGCAKVHKTKISLNEGKKYHIFLSRPQLGYKYL